MQPSDRSTHSLEVQEKVGAAFADDHIQAARDGTLRAIEALAPLVRPGMTETQAKALLKDLLPGLGCEKMWHAPQVRFGVNTRLPFGKPGVVDVPLGENDIFFLDFGLVYAGHEGDVGRTFALGNDPDMHRIATDAREIWKEVRDLWFTEKKSGAEIYAFAQERARARGWTLSLEEANGHRIGDFPHFSHYEGSVEGCVHALSENRWILEIQLKHPEKAFGAFYEDLLA